jgi:hypothetical protein
VGCALTGRKDVTLMGHVRFVMKDGQIYPAVEGAP